METTIKTLSGAVTNRHTKSLVQSHVKELSFANNHLVIYVDNAAPLHEFEDRGADEHLQKGLEKAYGEDITYELRLYKANVRHEREKQVPHNINQ